MGRASVAALVHAERAAMEEGIVAGGEVALLRARAALTPRESESDTWRTGAGIVHEALAAPLRQIAQNAGADAQTVVHKIAEAHDAKGHDSRAIATSTGSTPASPIR